MKQFGVICFAFALAACNDSIPAGIEPITVYVVDAISGASLCNADVTLNGTPLVGGGGNTIGCYYVPTFTMNVGDAYSLTVSQSGYVSQTQTGKIAADGSSLLVQLAPTSVPVDASVDAAPDATSNDASSSDAADAATD